jgi:hypothetical protein
MYIFKEVFDSSWYPVYILDHLYNDIKPNQSLLVKIGMVSCFGYIKIYVRTADDNGLEYEYDNSTKALDTFINIIKQKDLTKEYLLNLGFERNE